MSVSLILTGPCNRSDISTIMLFKQILILLLAFSSVRTSLNLLTDIREFKKEFLNFLRTRNHQSDFIQTNNPHQVPPVLETSNFQETKFVVPTVQPPREHPVRQPPKEQSGLEATDILVLSTPSPLPAFTTDGGAKKPVIFPDFGNFNQSLYREQTLTKNFHNKKIKI